MRVSILNLNLVGTDAIGKCIISQVHFFQRRGDTVRVFAANPPRDVGEDIASLTTVTTLNELVAKSDDHFRLSDLFIYHYPSRHALMDSIRVIERGAVIFYYHNVTPPELWSSPHLRAELVRGVRGVSLVHYADFAVADSPFNRGDLVRQGFDPERTFVLPLVVSLDHLRPGPRDAALVGRFGLENKRVMLFVGRMASNKRVDLLVDVLSLVKAEVPDVVLMLVGDADSTEPYRQVAEDTRRRAAELGVEDAIIFTGVKVDTAPYYRLADLYVTASLHEGFGLPLAEAMACGVPVVASRTTAHPWVLGGAGVLCEPEAPDDMARQVVQLLQDNKRYKELVHKGLERARAFSVEAYETGFAEVVNEATRWVQALPLTERRAQRTSAGTVPQSIVDPSEDRVLIDDLAELYAESDVMIRPYIVRSKLPLVGSFIAWLRRNMTSHLREPYLDPMFERQVAFNRQLVDALERTRGYASAQKQAFQKDLAARAERQARLEKKIELLEAKVRLLAARQQDADDAELQELQAEIAQLTAALDER